MILSILKIIGIVLLIILAFLILILGILLFVPLRYQFDGMYKDTSKATALVKWTPILLKVVVNYQDDKFEYVVRMLGGVVMTNMDIPLSWIGRKFFSPEVSDEEELDEIESEAPDMKDATHRERFESKKQVATLEKKIKKKKQSRSIIEKIEIKLRSVKTKIKQLIEKLRRINEKREALLKLYHHKRFEVAKKDAIAYIKALWNAIKPKKLEGCIHFGLEDPATTGQVLGILAMFLAWYDRFLQIEPDFEQACFDGELKGNGKFSLFPIVKLVIQVILNKNLIKVIKKVQTIIEA